MRNRRKIDKNTRTNVLKYQIRDFIVISKNFRYQKIIEFSKEARM